MGVKQKKLAGMADSDVPTWSVLGREQMTPLANANLAESQLEQLGTDVDEWTSDASNHALRYATHGLFRYFGKFPPLVARYLIEEYTKPGDLVFDPMIGCGTTAVESLLLGRECLGIDVNPLAILLTNVKCRRSTKNVGRVLQTVISEATRLHASKQPDESLWPTGIKTNHWFLPETSHWLWSLKQTIDAVSSQDDRELLLVALASIIRRVSKATTQQGRLFLDVETAEMDPRTRFEAAASEAIRATASLEAGQFQPTLHQSSCVDVPLAGTKAPLIICHPPYFNLYRYSSINSLEAAWLGHDTKAIRKKEVREFFKVGKPENVFPYVADMAAVLKHITPALSRTGTLALMVGDTVIHGQRIPTTKMIVDSVSDFLRPVRVSIRTPKFTEASWAASQRRTGKKVGITLADFIVHFRKR